MNLSPTAFLQANLAGLQHPHSVIGGAINDYCRGSVAQALSEGLSVLQAASDLTHALSGLHIGRLEKGLVDREGRPIPVVEKVTVRPLRDFAGENRWVDVFLKDSPKSGGLDVVEMTTLTDEYTDGVKQMTYRRYKGRADSPLVEENPVNKLMSFIRLGDVYPTFIQPKGTRVWRFPPLPFVMGAMDLIFGERAMTPIFTAHESSLDELRTCLEADGWPILIDAGPPQTNEPDDPGYFEAHGAPYDRYHMTIHDFMHALRWCGYARELRQDMLRVDDALLAAMETVPAALRGLEAFHGTRDNVLQSYMDEGRAANMLNSYLETDVRNEKIAQDFADGVMGDFKERLRENFRSHPRRTLVLGPHA